MRRDLLFPVASLLTILSPLTLVAGGAAADMALSAIAVLFLAHSFIQKDWKWVKQNWVWVLAILWLYMIVRGLFAEQPSVTLERNLPFIRYALFAAGLAYWTLQDNTTRRRFWWVLAIVVVFCAFDGLLQWFLGSDMLMHNIIYWEGHTRLTGPFKGQILGIMLAWLVFPVCLPLLLTPEGKFYRDRRLVERILAVGFVIATITLSGERMALLLAALGGLMALLLLPVRKRYMLMALGACALLIGAIAVASPALFKRDVLSTFETFENWDDSPYGRLLTSDMKVAQINPAFGVGTNHFRIACPRLYPERPPCMMSAVCNLHPHNMYMEWFIENGAIGLALFAIFVVAVLGICSRAWSYNRTNPAFIGFLIAFSLRIWPVASTTGIFSRWGAPVFWLVLGALLAYTVRVPKETSA